ncbi:LCP family protein [uncultured Granulicatella sp.]|uniref:LCP family glycopolymer transferase n=1 Tax=uncultured Granulicatella sp. TaxID=316089 RepID=UPI0028D405B1|nr:LCP family protein [uncultured Granulicatella sp.]
MSRVENHIHKKILKNKRKKWTIFFIVLAATLITVSGAYIRARLAKVENAIHQEVETVNLREKEITDNDSFSVLLLGIDNGAYGRGTEVGRSDTMLVVTVNEKLGKTTIVSIPRDSYTEIVGYGTNDKINHAYAFGQEKMSINSVQNMLNIPIDYYVTVDMGGLMGLVDAVGGLDITPVLTFTYEGESFTEGVDRHVDGEAALRYARMRYDDPEGDMGRQKRQQYVIQKLVEKLLNITSVTRYEEILKTLENSVRTNFTLDKLLSVKNNYPKALKNFESDKISGSGTMIGGIYYFVVPEDERLRISNLLRENLELQKVDSLKHIETNETQIVPEVENHQPTNSSFYQEEIADEYVEPATVPQVESNQPVAPATPVAPTTVTTTTVINTQKNDDQKVETSKGTQPAQPIQPTTVAPTKPETSSVELAPVPSNTTIEPKPAATETNNKNNQ